MRSMKPAVEMRRRTSSAAPTEGTEPGRGFMRAGGGRILDDVARRGACAAVPASGVTGGRGVNVSMAATQMISASTEGQVMNNIRPLILITSLVAFGVLFLGSCGESNEQEFERGYEAGWMSVCNDIKRDYPDFWARLRDDKTC